MKLPVMKCDRGCGECCGPVLCTEQEFQRVARFVREHSIEPTDNGITCPLYIDGTCSVHRVRPLACRIFGHSDKMKCSRGYNVNVPDRKLRRAITRRGIPTRYLHELIDADGSRRLIASLRDFFRGNPA